MDWKKTLEPSLQSHLDFQLKESSKSIKSIKKAKEPSKAQLWVAVANLSRLVSALNLRVKELEEKLEKKNVKKKAKISKKSKKR